MRSIVLVGLQFALLAAMAWPRVGAASPPVAFAVIAAGGLLGIWALAANRPGNFNIRPLPKIEGRLIESGPYRFVRHPMYLAVLLVALGLLIRDPVWWRGAALLMLAFVLHLKAAIEEVALTKLHLGYAAYRERTARFIPFLR